MMDFSLVKSSTTGLLFGFAVASTPVAIAQTIYDCKGRPPLQGSRSEVTLDDITLNGFGATLQIVDRLEDPDWKHEVSGKATKRISRTGEVSFVLGDAYDDDLPFWWTLRLTGPSNAVLTPRSSQPMDCILR